MKKFVIVLISILAMVLGFAAPASAAPGEPLATITLDANNTGLDLTPSAEDWSKNTDVLVTVGSCEASANCVEFSLDQCVAGTAGGCAWAGENGSCNVSIEPIAYTFDYWLTVFVISHEVGHCLTWLGGAGMFHVDDEKSIMYWQGYIQTMREQATKVFSSDRKMISSIYSGTWS